MKLTCTLLLLCSSLITYAQFPGFAYRNFYRTQNLSLSGNTQQMDGVLRLVRAETWQGGGVWYTAQQVPVARGFETEFTFRITKTCGCEHGADGVALVLHTNRSAVQQGAKGEGIGYGGIGQSVAIEFDAFDNREGTDHHVSIHPHGKTHPSAALATNHSLPNLKDDRWHKVRIVYQTGRMKVYFDDLNRPVLDAYITLEKYLRMNDGKAWIGITSATGGDFAHHYLGSWRFKGIDIPEEKKPEPAPKPVVVSPRPATPPSRPVAVVSETNLPPRGETPSPRPEPQVIEEQSPAAPLTLENRPVTTTRTITVRSRNITLYLWDHNKKDGDIISINLNNQWVVNRFRLKKKKKPFDIYLGQNSNSLILHAHNLGRIPPNTASMIVYDGYRRQKVTLRSDLQTSEAVRIVYEQP